MIKENLKKRFLTSLALFSIFFLVINYNFILIFILIIFFVISIIEFLNITIKINNNKLFLLFSNFLFIIYIFALFIFFFYLTSDLQPKIIAFSILMSCISSDIGGFFFGKLFKGPKLTKISPNKTYSGALGSLIFSGISFGVLMFIFTKNFNLAILLVGAITSIGSQTGDLFFSYLKRKAKIKDTGNLLPGHGGILDRLDSLLIGIPVGFLSLMIIF